jgi:hypothetical protein
MTDTGTQLINDVNLCFSLSGSGTGIAPPAGDLGGTAITPTVVSTHLTAPLPTAQGGNGSASPGIVAGTGCSVSGSWPTQTITCSGGGGGGGSFPLAGNVSAANFKIQNEGNATVAGDVLAYGQPGAQFNDLALLQALTTGTNGGTSGSILMNGSLSGQVALGVAAAAGAGTVFQFPANNGTAGYVLGDPAGNGIAQWVPAGSFSGSLGSGAHYSSVGGALPTVSSCGTGAVVTPGSTDPVGTVTVGTPASVTSCLITFVNPGGAPANSPMCAINDVSHFQTIIPTEATTSMTLTALTDMSGDMIQWHCFGKG